MKITSLGHGGAFASYAQGNSSFLIENNGEKLLFDCGPLTPLVLRDEMGIDLFDINYIYISHTHADHIGGLPLLLQHRFWIPRENKTKPIIVAHVDVMRELMPFLQNELEHTNVITKESVSIEKFFEYHRIDDEAYVDALGEFMIQSERSYHTINSSTITNLGGEYKPCYGLKFYAKTRNYEYDYKLYVSGDNADYKYSLKYTVYLPECMIVDCETLPAQFASGVHCPLTNLIDMNKKSVKMYLTHYSNESSVVLPENMEYFTKGKTITI